MPIWVLVTALTTVFVLGTAGVMFFNRKPQLSPQDCIQNVFKSQGVDVFAANRDRITGRIATMSCAELNEMLTYAKQVGSEPRAKTMTPVEIQNATVVMDAMKLRASVAGCAVTADGYAEPPSGGTSK